MVFICACTHRNKSNDCVTVCDHRANHVRNRHQKQDRDNNNNEDIDNSCSQSQSKSQRRNNKQCLFNWLQWIWLFCFSSLTRWPVKKIDATWQHLNLNTAHVCCVELGHWFEFDWTRCHLFAQSFFFSSFSNGIRNFQPVLNAYDLPGSKSVHHICLYRARFSM